MTPKEIKQKIGDRLKLASAAVHKATHGEAFGDDDSVNLVRLGWNLGVAYQNMDQVFELIHEFNAAQETTLTQEQLPANTATLLTMATNGLSQATLETIDDDGNIDFLRLGVHLGVVMQILNSLIFDAFDIDVKTQSDLDAIAEAWK